MVVIAGGPSLSVGIPLAQASSHRGISGAFRLPGRARGQPAPGPCGSGDFSFRFRQAAGQSLALSLSQEDLRCMLTLPTPLV